MTASNAFTVVCTSITDNCLGALPNSLCSKANLPSVPYFQLMIFVMYFQWAAIMCIDMHAAPTLINSLKKKEKKKANLPSVFSIKDFSQKVPFF
jgi:hypothetical protein